MRDTMGNSTWSRRGQEPPVPQGEANDTERSVCADDSGVAVLELEVGPNERALLEEAMRLLNLKQPGEVLRVALRELVERQRFLSWVAAHDRSERSGNA
jgi:hypothetical protein